MGFCAALATCTQRLSRGIEQGLSERIKFSVVSCPLTLFLNWSPWELAMLALLSLCPSPLCTEVCWNHAVGGGGWGRTQKAGAGRDEGNQILLQIRWFQFSAFNQSEGVQVIKESNYSRNQWSLPVSDQEITVGFRKTLKRSEWL